MNTAEAPFFQHLAPAQRVYCGEGSLASLGRELARLGCTRAAIVCGASLSRNQHQMAHILEAVGGRAAGVIEGAVEHSPVPAVLSVAQELRRLQADAVVAVGGGSAIVTARAAAIVLAEGTDVSRLCSQKGASGQWTSPRLEQPKLPQFVVPTTPTTACVKAGSAVLDVTTGQRLTLFDPKTRAQALFVDPQMVATAPQPLVLSASMNTLAMAVEGLESPQAHPFSDALLMQALRLLSEHLLAEDTPASRCQLLLAAALCGQGTDFGGAGMASVLGHAMGHSQGVANGLVNAVVLPHTMRFNAPATARGIAHVAIALGAASHPRPGIEEAIERVKLLLDVLPLPRRLRDLGIPSTALAGVAEKGMSDWFLQRNPRPVHGPSDLLAVLEAAW
ncbi:iron-containing alcohol dehydrogenase [bacterium BD-1]|nr:iron-containing alcohol dehydrogenase [Ottowia caeni]